jgi:hypothetical protein
MGKFEKEGPMKKLLFALLVTAIAPLAYAQYTAPATPEAAKEPTPAAGAAADKNALATQANSDASSTKAILGDRNCLRETGSNIVRKGNCVNATGQAYGQTAIERTGTYDTGVALERMSPAISVRGVH